MGSEQRENTLDTDSAMVEEVVTLEETIGDLKQSKTRSKTAFTVFVSIDTYKKSKLLLRE